MFIAKKVNDKWDIVDEVTGESLLDVSFIEFTDRNKNYLTKEEAIQMADAINKVMAKMEVTAKMNKEAKKKEEKT